MLVNESQELIMHKIFIKTFKPKQNGHHFVDHILKVIIVNKNCNFLIHVSLKFVSQSTINDKQTLI